MEIHLHKERLLLSSKEIMMELIELIYILVYPSDT